MQPPQETDSRQEYPGAPIRLVKVVCNFESGGTEGQILEFVRRLDRRRFALAFACLDPAGPHRREYEAQGHPIECFSPGSFLSWRAPRQIRRLADWLRRQRVEIVHAYNFHAILLALPAARLAGVPVVLASIRDRGAYLGPLQRLAQKAACRLADRVLVNAEAIRDWLLTEGYPAGRIDLIRNGVDLEPFARALRSPALRQELDVPLEAPLVLLVARLHRQKGLEEFIRAAGLVAQRFPQAHYRVVGPATEDCLLPRGEGGTDLERWQALAESLGLGGRLRFTGAREDIPALLAEAAVSVLPSWNEGLSNSLLEAMAAGVPVVATRVGGSPELIEDGASGILVPSREPEALALAIQAILDDSALARRLGENGRRRAREAFSVEAMSRRTQDLYLDCLRRARQRPRPAGLIQTFIGG